MKSFEEILSYHTGYPVEELAEREGEPLLQPADVYLAVHEFIRQGTGCRHSTSCSLGYNCERTGTECKEYEGCLSTGSPLPSVDPLDDENSEIHKIGREMAEMDAGIRAEMDVDMKDSGVAQGEIESCLNHWGNKYVIQRKELLGSN